MERLLALLDRLVLDEADRQRLLDEVHAVVHASSGADERTTEPGPPGVGGAATLRPEGERYEDRGALGRGGMGEVRRVLDRHLGRTLALKVIQGELVGDRLAIARFASEAQVTAQLQHPGVVPVYDVGWLQDGRPFYTMQEIRGKTLSAWIVAVHRASSPEAWGEVDGVGLRRLLEWYRRLCEAVGYAHARGVVHRDLKPDNLMIGDFGAVHVLDWGLARVLGTDADDELHTVLGAPDSPGTLLGTTPGTPGYLAPELAAGVGDDVSAASDVFSLGAVLAEILTGEVPQAGAGGPVELRAALLARSEHAPAAMRPGPPIPDGLAVVVEDCLRLDPTERPGSGSEVGAAVSTWLDGAWKRDRALAVVQDALAIEPEITRLRAEAERDRADAKRLLAAVANWAPEADKLDGWRKDDRAVELDRRADELDGHVEMRLEAALTHAPDLPEAHRALARRYRDAQAAAESAGQEAAAERAAQRLEVHVRALPPGDADRRSHLAWLRGDGVLSLVTDPPALATLYRYVPLNRRLVAENVERLGKTPLQRVRLPMGSYVVELVAEGHVPVRYPVHIPRRATWDGVPPGGRKPWAIRLPPVSELGPDECYVPGGYFASDGDDRVPVPLPRRMVWVDGFIAQRYHVTHAEYVAFLDDLVARGQGDEAARWVPREMGAKQQGAPVYVLSDDGRWRLPQNVDDGLFHPRAPVSFVSLFAAQAWLQWESERTGKRWRLPSELEWEKAARGVDGRTSPWGESHDPSWSCSMGSFPRPHPVPVDDFPIDESPYGVRHMAGNLREWTGDTFRPDGAPVREGRAIDPAEAPAAPYHMQVLRGGAWNMGSVFSRLAVRGHVDPQVSVIYAGFRAFRSWG